MRFVGSGAQVDGNPAVSIPLEKSSDEVEDVMDDRPIDPAAKRFDLLASRLTL